MFNFFKERTLADVIAPFSKMEHDLEEFIEHSFNRHETATNLANELKAKADGHFNAAKAAGNVLEKVRNLIN